MRYDNHRTRIFKQILFFALYAIFSISIGCATQIIIPDELPNGEEITDIPALDYEDLVGFSALTDGPIPSSGEKYVFNDKNIVILEYSTELDAAAALENISYKSLIPFPSRIPHAYYMPPNIIYFAIDKNIIVVRQDSYGEGSINLDINYARKISEMVYSSNVEEIEFSPNDLDENYYKNSWKLYLGNIYPKSIIEFVYVVPASEIRSYNLPAWAKILNINDNISMNHSWGWENFSIISISVTPDIESGWLLDNITFNTSEGQYNLWLSAKVRNTPSAVLNLLVCTTPFDYGGQSPGNFFGFSKFLELNGVNYSYTFELPGNISLYNTIIVGQGFLATISESDAERLKGFVRNGGTIIVFANSFYVNTIDGANRIINDFGLRMEDREYNEGDDLIVQDIENDPVTDNITDLVFSRPSPIFADGSHGSKIIAKNPLNSDEGFFALSREGGTLFVIGESLYESFLMRRQFQDAPANNSELFINMLRGSDRTVTSGQPTTTTTTGINEIRDFNITINSDENDNYIIGLRAKTEDCEVFFDGVRNNDLLVGTTEKTSPPTSLNPSGEYITHEAGPEWGFYQVANLPSKILITSIDKEEGIAISKDIERYAHFAYSENYKIKDEIICDNEGNEIGLKIKVEYPGELTTSQKGILDIKAITKDFGYATAPDLQNNIATFCEIKIAGSEELSSENEFFTSDQKIIDKEMLASPIVIGDDITPDHLLIPHREWLNYDETLGNRISLAHPTTRDLASMAEIAQDLVDIPAGTLYDTIELAYAKVSGVDFNSGLSKQITKWQSSYSIGEEPSDIFESENDYDSWTYTYGFNINENLCTGANGAWLLWPFSFDSAGDYDIRINIDTMYEGDIPSLGVKGGRIGKEISITGIEVNT